MNSQISLNGQEWTGDVLFIYIVVFTKEVQYEKEIFARSCFTDMRFSESDSLCKIRLLGTVE